MGIVKHAFQASSRANFGLIYRGNNHFGNEFLLQRKNESVSWIRNAIPKNSIHSKTLQENDGDSIVISGIGGRFPQCDTINELKENLNNGVDLVQENDRFDLFNPMLPPRMGLMKNANKFDAGFFNINPQMAEAMDLNQRKLLEVTFEAMMDAGINPNILRNTKTGVYIGTVGGESTEYWLVRGAQNELEGYKVMGNPNLFQAGRVSYHFDLKGSSMTISTGCSASLTAMEYAVVAIQNGLCDQAIVAGTQIHMTSTANLELALIAAISPDGTCKVFDESANGFARSEAVVAILLQRKRDAKRHYVTVRGIKSNADGFKREGVTFPSSKSQEALLRETYAATGIDPGQVKYFEAHGTGTAVGDPIELTAISNVVCKAESRTEPLLVGSVKSNVGHTESSAGLTSLAKIFISLEQGIIPANLHYKNPSPHLSHLLDESIKIVDQPTSWNGGLIGMSSFGLAGSNVHAILESGPRVVPENIEAQKKLDEKEIPIIIPFSGRTKKLVEESITEACKVGENIETCGLLYEAFKHKIPNHSFRGYGIFSPGQEDKPFITVDKVESTENRPLWFVFPGMGSQWNEMGKELMKLDAYEESIRSSKITLKNVGVDLDHLLRPNNSSIFDNIRDSLVSITAVQVALYDTLISMGLKPDGFLGHSSGEILCAYADGCMTAEEALLVGNARGRSFYESVSDPGGMASIGLSWEEAKLRCPPTIFPACHNAAENVSVSGPLEDIEKFVKELQSKGVFARMVNSCLCAPHSKYVYPAGDLLFKYMNEIYQDERPRSSKWISSSIPESKWNTPLAKTSSAAYHVNNLSRPVLFQEALLKIPKNTVVIEIAPRGLFQPLLRGTLSQDCTLIAPMHHTAEDKVHFFLSSVGKMYNAGLDLNIGKLYPTIKFPVSSATPSISSLIKWDHEQNFRVHSLQNFKEDVRSYTKIDLADRKQSFLEGHKLDSRCVFPATGYIVHTWNTFANSKGHYFLKYPVILENIRLERATFLKDSKPVSLRYSLIHESNQFGVAEEGIAVIKGEIKHVEDSTSSMLQLLPNEIPEIPKRRTLDSNDVYKEFRLRGYNYTGEFRGIRLMDNEGKWAKVAWRGNWISFLDTMLQTTLLSIHSRSTGVPVRIKSILIDPIKFLNYVNSQEKSYYTEVEEINSEGKEKVMRTYIPDEKGSGRDEILVPVSIYPHLETIQCPGIEIRGLTGMVVPRQKQKETLSVEEYSFRPYADEKSNNIVAENNKTNYSNVAELIDLVLENIPTTVIKTVDVFTKVENSLSSTITDIIGLKPLHKMELSILTTSEVLESLDEKIKNLAATVTSKDTQDKLVPEAGLNADLLFLDEPSLLSKFSKVLKDNSFVILRSMDSNLTNKVPELLRLVSTKLAEDDALFLLKKLPLEKVVPKIASAVCVDGDHFDWLPNLQKLMSEAAKNEQADLHSRFYIYSQNNPESGIVGMTKCLRFEDGGDKLRCIFDPEGKLSLDFKSPGKELQEIIDQDLVMNTIKGGKLGSYRHIPMSQDAAAPTKEVTHAYVNTLTTGDLTSLRWVESPLAYLDPVKDQAKGQVCTVHYAAMNFRDIMLATGKLPVDSKSAFNHQDCNFGFEFSGVDQQGKRVMGVMGSKAMASSVLIGPDAMIWSVPSKWTLADAATVPVVYSTAYYALFNRARLRPGQSILIHSGTGGVGQAAINIALDLNCEVYTTVGTEDKKKYIKELFPTLKEENIGHSRDCSFEKQILELTNGRGVDIVLNSLADDKLQASIRCVALHGKFLEIGAFDSFQNTNLGMECFLKNVDFSGIFLNHFLTGSQAEKEALEKHFLDGIERGVVKPLPRSIFEKEQIEEAFRFMAGGKHLGKVLIEVQKEECIGQTPKLKAVPRSYFSERKSYVIVGGLGGMGLELANWLVDRGARHLILTSRSGITKGYQELCLRKWEEKGVNVETPKLDLSSYSIAENFIRELTSNGKEIGGIFNSGLVLKDALIEEITTEDFEQVAAPKTRVTKNLDKLTRQYCKKGLDYFVTFSSMACGRGNSGQSNYGLANSVMEQICEKRKKDGLHGLAIQWGIIGEVGAVAEGIFGAKLTGEEVFDGTLAQRINSCLDVLDMTLHRDASVVSSMVLAEDDGKKSKRGGLIETISHICGAKDLSNISPETKLIDLGMDSLIGMEIKQLIERDYDTPLTAQEIRSMTFHDLHMIEAGTYVKGQSTKQGQGIKSQNEVDLIEVLKNRKDTVMRLNSAEEEEDSNKLFIVHGAECHSFALTLLADRLNCTVYGFQLLSMNNAGETTKDALWTIESLARTYIQELKNIQPKGPYQIGSYSAGGVVAHKMAHILEKEFGDTVENMIYLDGFCDGTKIGAEKDRSIQVRTGLNIMKNTFPMSEEDEELMYSKLVELDTDTVSQAKLAASKVLEKLPSVDPELVTTYFLTVNTFTQLFSNYTPTEKLMGKVTLIKANEKSHVMSAISDETHYLQEFAEEPVTIHTVHGDHYSFLSEENVAESANIINNLLGA